MRLDEALYHRWAGKDIKRKCWSLTLKESMYNSGKEGMLVTLREKDIDADDWEVVPKYVGWDEAWKALEEHKVIEIDGLPWILDTEELFLYRADLPRVQITQVPIRWFTKKKMFVIKED